VAMSGHTLYFADTGSDSVGVIDAATLNPKDYNPAETDIHVGFDPGDLAVTPDGSQLWVADTGPQTSPASPTAITVISTATDKVTATLPLPAAPAQIAFAPSGATAYVTTADGLWAYSTATDHVTGIIRGLGDPHGVTGIAAVVARNHFELPAEHAALGVDLLDRELHALAIGLEEGGRRLVAVELADFDRLRGGGRDQRRAGKAGERDDLLPTGHRVLQK